MSQSFTCPNCGAPLDYDGDDLTVRCPYCSSSVIVPETLRAAPAAVPPHTPSLPVVGMDALLSQAVKLKEVARLIRSGNKIEAIKVYREIFDVGLKEAKEAVEKLEAGQPIVMPGSAAFATTSAMAYRSAGFESTSTDTRDTEAEIARWLSEGKKIEAIKVYRQVYGVGLKEAKDAVEAYQAGQLLPKPAHPAAPPTTTTSRTYTNAPQSGRGSAVGAWGCLMFGFFWVAFLLIMVGTLIFPDIIVLAAPVFCPEGYLGAYGEAVGRYVTSGFSGTNVTLLRCIDIEGQVVTPFPPYVDGLLCGGFLLFFGIVSFFLVAIGRARSPIVKSVWVGLGSGVVVLIIGGVLFYSQGIPASEASVSNGVNSERTAVAHATEAPIPTIAPAPTAEEPVIPVYAPLVLSFGKGEGDGPGYFNDARAITVDGAGNVYVADYSGGRIQVFDSAGEFRNQWKVEGADENVYITGMAANREGRLYVVYEGNIHRYDGESGRLQGKISYEAAYVQDVAVSPFGDWAAVSNETVASFDQDDQLTASAALPFENLDVEGVAVDAKGNVYLAASSRSAILMLSPQLKLLDQIGSKGDGPGRVRSPYGVAVDGRGNIYVGDHDGIEVFTADGNPLALLEVEIFGFDLTISDSNELYYLDRNANKVLKFELP